MAMMRIIFRKMNISWILWGMMVIGIGGCALGWILELWGAFPACKLCHIERWICLGGGVFAGLSLVLQNLCWGRLFLYATLFTWLSGVGVCIYHTGIQYKWFAVPTFCRVSRAPHLKAFLSAPQIGCEQRSLEIFSLPVPLYLILLFLAMSFCIIYLLRRF